MQMTQMDDTWYNLFINKAFPITKSPPDGGAKKVYQR
jgi:hypothetical protein